MTNPNFASRTRQSTFETLPGCVWNILVTHANASLIGKPSKKFTPLDKIATINRGLITGDRAKYFSRTKATNAHVPIIAGRNAHRYHCSGSSEYVLFKRPKTSGGCRDPDVHFAKHKIAIRQISDKPTASILLLPLAVTGNIFIVRADSLETEWSLLGIINSRLTECFWRTMFADFKTSSPK